jgi:hypothetical protein
MTERKQERKPGKKIKIDKLELAKETVRELADAEAERVEGGAATDRGVKTPMTYAEGC